MDILQAFYIAEKIEPLGKWREYIICIRDTLQFIFALVCKFLYIRAVFREQDAGEDEISISERDDILVCFIEFFCGVIVPACQQFLKFDVPSAVLKDSNLRYEAVVVAVKLCYASINSFILKYSTNVYKLMNIGIIFKSKYDSSGYVQIISII